MMVEVLLCGKKEDKAKARKREKTIDCDEARFVLLISSNEMFLKLLVYLVEFDTRIMAHEVAVKVSFRNCDRGHSLLWSRF